MDKVNNRKPEMEEKIKLDDQEEQAPPAKRHNTSRTQDITELFTQQEKTQPGVQEQEESQETNKSQTTPPTVYYGQEEEVEMTNWEENFRAHIEETNRLEKEGEDKIERADKKEQSWQLLRECTRFLRENEKCWKEEENKNCKAAKNNRLNRAENQKVETLRKVQQKKITESWNRLPENEKKRLEQEEEKRRKLDLRDAKMNLWKKWRKVGKQAEQPIRSKEDEDKHWIDKIEEH